MLRLPFLPEFFPVLLLPLWWVFLLCFYVVYLPVYFVLWLFSPWRSRKDLVAFYSRKASSDSRTVSYSGTSPSSGEDGGGDNGEEGR